MLDYRANTFLTVCRTGGFTRAATELHITQPAVSQHIRQLEAHYGCPLFAKTGRGVEPTDAGRLLYRALDVAENDETRLLAELAALRRGEDARPPLRLGCTRTIADHVAPGILARHLVAHPRERILMRAGNTAELVDSMDRGEIDFALVEGPYDHEAFDGAALSRERLVAISAAGGPPASIEGLLGERLILREPGSGTREILERHLAAHDRSIDDFAGTIELAGIPAIKACVAAGAGVSFIYRVAVEAELASGALADVTPADFAISHDFSLIWQQGSRYADRYRALLRAWRAATLQ